MCVNKNICFLPQLLAKVFMFSIFCLQPCVEKIDFRDYLSGPEQPFSYEIRPDFLCAVEGINVFDGLVRIIGEFENGVVIF